MNRLIKFGAILLLASLLAIVIALVFHPFQRQVELSKYAKATSSKLAAHEKEIASLGSDTALLSDIVNNTFASKYFPQLQAKPYEVLVYINEELLVWSNNASVPPPYLANALAEGSNFLKLENGYYVITKISHKVNNLDLVFLGVELVKTNYRIENNYLRNYLNPRLELPDYLDISIGPIANSEPVRDANGEDLFYLMTNDFLFSQSVNYPLLIWQSACLLLYLIAFNCMAVGFWQRGKPWLGIAIFVAGILALRWAMLGYGFPEEWGKLGLFNPQYYASSTINKSLGDLLLNMLLILNWAMLLFFFFPQWVLPARFGWLRLPLATMSYLAVCAMSWLLSGMFNNLVFNSSIPFNLNNFMSLNGYSIMGLVAICIALSAFLMLTYRLLLYVHGFRLSFIELALAFLLAFTAYGLNIFLNDGKIVDYMGAVLVPTIVLFIGRQISNGRPIAAFANGMVIIIIFSAISAVYMYQYNSDKELEQQKLMARKLADQRDRVTEYLFSDIQERIFKDAFIRNFFLTPFISTEQIQQRIRSLYLGGYFNKYDIDIYLINKSGEPLQEVDERFYELEDPNAELSPPSDFLFFIPKDKGNYLYSGNLPILYQNKFIGTVILRLSPKSYTKTNLYPELLLQESIKPNEQQEMYSYAIYSNDQLIKKQGLYPYTSIYSFKPTSQEYRLQGTNGLNHLIYNDGDKKKVVVTSQRANWLRPITLFSYLFCFFLIFSFFILLIRVIHNFLRQKASFRLFANMGFKDKIQYAMIFVLVVSFLFIGLVTIFYFSSQYDTQQLALLIDKQAAILANVQYELGDADADYLRQRDGNKNQEGKRNLDLAILSDVHNMDVNLYDLQGNVLNTSQPDIFDKGLISDKINAEAYRNLVVEHKSQFVQNEVIGNLKYLSIYVPVRNITGEAVAFLNLPYFGKEKELRAELSSYLVALINVYVFLLVMGGFIAYVFASSITASLSIISEKLKLIQLGRKNEPILWRGRDEIGTLVAEYNKMIYELEQSAERLARSERESAWREMAKQVAHEIKNPLTPMKLSIQHLQRAINEGRPDVDVLAKKVANTLIEQIESLNHIASEFSSFAKMPAVQNEVFDLVEVVRSVADLFNEEVDSDVFFRSPTLPVWVYADKNQVMRGFTNLVKNASQAIPEGRKGAIQIAMDVAGNFVTTSVKDNGTGIPVELRSKVFVPNFTTKGSGTGLGLALTRQIVEGAGGEIWFDSVLDEGTTFFVKLPLHNRTT